MNKVPVQTCFRQLSCLSFYSISRLIHEGFFGCPTTGNLFPKLETRSYYQYVDISLLALLYDIIILLLNFNVWRATLEIWKLIFQWVRYETINDSSKKLPFVLGIHLLWMQLVPMFFISCSEDVSMYFCAISGFSK